MRRKVIHPGNDSRNPERGNHFHQDNLNEII